MLAIHPSGENYHERKSLHNALPEDVMIRKTLTRLHFKTSSVKYVKCTVMVAWGIVWWH